MGLVSKKLTRDSLLDGAPIKLSLISRTVVEYVRISSVMMLGPSRVKKPTTLCTVLRTAAWSEPLCGVPKKTIPVMEFLMS